MSKFYLYSAVIVGVLLLAVGLYYILTPAGALPTFVPGYEAGSVHVHIKHGIGATLLALGLFAYAWFASGSKRT